MELYGYEILIVSPFDREYLVAEITKEPNFFAEINQEKGFLEISIYGNNNMIEIADLNLFCKVLNKAKLKLSDVDLDTKNMGCFSCQKNESSIAIYYYDTLIAKANLLSNKVNLEIIIPNQCITFPFNGLYKTFSDICMYI